MEVSLHHWLHFLFLPSFTSSYTRHFLTCQSSRSQAPSKPAAAELHRAPRRGARVFNTVQCLLRQS